MVVAVQGLDVCVVVGRIPQFDSEVGGACDCIVSSCKVSSNPPMRLPVRSKSTSMTAFVWPLTVLSISPPSQSQILTVVSSLAVARTVHVGWNARRVTGARCEASVWRGGGLGMKGAEGEGRAGEASSARRAALRASRSMICGVSESGDG